MALNAIAWEAIEWNGMQCKWKGMETGGIEEDDAATLCVLSCGGIQLDSITYSTAYHCILHCIPLQLWTYQSEVCHQVQTDKTPLPRARCHIGDARIRNHQSKDEIKVRESRIDHREARRRNPEEEIEARKADFTNQPTTVTS